jgi:hypothetical protein
MHKITFHPNGTASTLYTEALPLRELGELKIERASSIEFNNATQEWEALIYPVSGIRYPVFSHPSRQACLRWEHEQLNQ